MRPASLIILVDDIVAQKLAATWPFLSKHPTDELSQADIEEWTTIAGVLPDHRAERVCKALLAHEICLPDGTLYPIADKYITHCSTQDLKRVKKKP